MRLRLRRLALRLAALHEGADAVDDLAGALRPGATVFCSAAIRSSLSIASLLTRDTMPLQ